MAKQKKLDIIRAHTDDETIAEDPHTDVKPVRVDARTVIYVPRSLSKEQVQQFIERWQSSVMRSRRGSGKYY
jgi:hypothetical protein